MYCLKYLSLNKNNRRNIYASGHSACTSCGGTGRWKYNRKNREGTSCFVGAGQDDTKEIADKYLRKLLGLRIFEDENGKTNLSLKDVYGALLIVSQFTLYANCKKGNRPSFIEAGEPHMAEALYEYMIDEAKKSVPVVEHGEFGADMKVSLLNDGPFTIILDEKIL